MLFRKCSKACLWSDFMANNMRGADASARVYAGLENDASELTNAHCRPMQVAEKDLKWGKHLMENLPDTEEDDDLTQDNNRQGLP